MFKHHKDKVPCLSVGCLYGLKFDFNDKESQLNLQFKFIKLKLNRDKIVKSSSTRKLLICCKVLKVIETCKLMVSNLINDHILYYVQNYTCGHAK